MKWYTLFLWDVVFIVCWFFLFDIIDKLRIQFYKKHWRMEEWEAQDEAERLRWWSVLLGLISLVPQYPP